MSWIIMLMFLNAFQFSLAQFTGSDIDVFLSMTSGHYSNVGDLSILAENGVKTKQSVLDVYWRALQIPALDWNYAVYIEKYADGVLILQQVLHLTEVNTVIHVQQHNLTHPENFVPNTFDISKLETLGQDDLSTRKECESIVRRIDQNVFVMQWPDCSVYGETSSRYSITFTCTSAGFIITPNTFYEDSSKLPYRIIKVKSYPVCSAIAPDQDLTLCQCGQ